MAETKQKITKDMTIADVVQKYPQTAEVMLSYGLHCVGCHVASFETIEQGARAHGMTDKQLVSMIDEMNKKIKKFQKNQLKPKKSKNKKT